MKFATNPSQPEVQEPKATRTKHRKRKVIIYGTFASLLIVTAGSLSPINKTASILVLFLGLLLTAFALRLNLINHAEDHKKANLLWLAVVIPSAVVCGCLFWQNFRLPPDKDTDGKTPFKFAFGQMLRERVDLTNDLLVVPFGRPASKPVGTLGIPYNSVQESLRLYFIVQNDLPEKAEDLQITLWTKSVYGWVAHPDWDIWIDEQSTPEYSSWVYRVPSNRIPLSGSWVAIPPVEVPLLGLPWKTNPAIRLMARANKSPAFCIQFTVLPIPESIGFKKPALVIGQTNKNGSIDTWFPVSRMTSNPTLTQ